MRVLAGLLAAFAITATGAVLAGCEDSETDDSPELTSEAERFARFLFFDQGASRPETACGVETLVDRIGAEELNLMPEEFRKGDTQRYERHVLDVVAVSEECGVDDHRQVHCQRPRDAQERELCEDFEDLNRPGGFRRFQEELD